MIQIGKRKTVILFFFSLVAIISFTCSLSVSAQTLYMPRNVKKAYVNGTRSMDGKPGKNYWQNFAKYTIDITATPPNPVIKGKETIVYFNNSNDTLRNPSIKLFLNFHKPGAARDDDAPSVYLNDGVIIDKATANGETVSVNNESAFTNLFFRLPKRLAPHDSVRLTFEWHYTISMSAGREEMVDSTTYFLGLYYPRVAVFDDYRGWDRIPYTGSREFYSDFNDYDVVIHVPPNFIVWGTGTLQEPEKLLQPAILKRWQQSLSSDEKIRIVTKEDIAQKKVTTQNPVNHWRYVGKRIPDVVFGISDHFVWDGTSVVVDDATGRRAGAQAVYNDTTREYHSMTSYVRHSLDWFSHHWPGLPFPYEKLVYFQTFEEMEYPMLVKGSAYGDTTFAKFVTEHEIVHTYFPFYMGTNETRYGFMDEGWATTFELLIRNEDVGVEEAEKFYKRFRVNGWINDPSAGQDMAIINPSENVTAAALGNNEYGKPSLAYLALKDLLGDAAFKKCLLGFMDRWHGKHPIPWDMFFTFNDVSGKNLNWFWENWFFTNNYIDVGIESVKVSGKECLVSIKNIGGMAIPLDVIVTFKDGTTKTVHHTPAIWEADQRKAILKIPSSKPVVAIKLDGRIFMDADMGNNRMKADKSGAFVLSAE